MKKKIQVKNLREEMIRHFNDKRQNFTNYDKKLFNAILSSNNIKEIN
ncbi:MAG: hypothetical protein II393_02225 [Cytophagales bacterium]|nr:hypothetical protein [Cytophagales bacterium]